MFTDFNGTAPLIAQTIQLSIAPVFLLTAIGAFLSAITTRLGRVIDRARILESHLPEQGQGRELSLQELRTLDRRMVLANRAVALCVSSAIIISSLVIVLFVSALNHADAGRLIPLLFIVALLLLTAALVTFALEVRVSIRTVRVRAELVTKATPHHPNRRFKDLLP